MEHAFLVGCFMKKIAIPFCILCLALLFGLTACSNNNDNSNGTEDIGQTYYLPYEIDNTGCIKRFYANETNSVNIVIPSTYSIDESGRIISGKAYEVKTIGNHCFANNNLIESVNIPESITTIEDCAFYNCANITTINITSKIASIGKDAFELCPQLKTITNNGKNGLIVETNKNLTSFIIPSSITKIENNSFANWEQLATISIENAVNYIGNNAFSHCQNLSRVSINSCLNYLGKNTFSNCEKLTSLTNSSSSTNGIYFAPKQALSSFVVPLSITSIQNEFFYGWKQLKEVEIHEAISSLGMIFKDNENLTTLTCGSKDVLSLFYHYTKYETRVTGSITETGGESFYVVRFQPYSGSYFYYYLIPNNLTEVHLLNDIDSHCFYNMTSLKRVYLPNDITTFGQGSFAGCSGLTNVYFSTDSDWRYSMSYYTSDSGTISKSDMNNSTQLANQLKAHNGYYYYWNKV